MVKRSAPKSEGFQRKLEFGHCDHSLMSVGSGDSDNAQLGLIEFTLNISVALGKAAKGGLILPGPHSSLI